VFGSWTGERTEENELGSIDYARLTSQVATCWARPQEGFRGGRWRRSLSDGLSEPWPRTIVIFALIHRPILPLSYVALGRRWRRLI
jgi:hypothetical protein